MVYPVTQVQGLLCCGQGQLLLRACLDHIDYRNDFRLSDVFQRALRTRQYARNMRSGNVFTFR